MEDVRTLQADKDMVKRIDQAIISLLNPTKGISVDGVDRPTRTSYSLEMKDAITGQRIVIEALAIYKQWKIDNGKTNDDNYASNRKGFSSSHPATALVLDAISKSN